MQLCIRIGEVLTPELMNEHGDHIRDFLVLEGVQPDPNDLAATELTERQIKELLAELAEQA